LGQREFVRRCASFSSIALDTSGCIYYLARVAGRYELVLDILSRASRGATRVILSSIVQLELLVQPFRTGSPAERRKVLTLTHATPGVALEPITDDIVFAAAEIRALTRMRTPDALVIATASARGCDAIIGNDRDFARISGVDPGRWSRPGARFPEYVHLDDYVD
jgi:predicted nucleic acid-binding protein